MKTNHWSAAVESAASAAAAARLLTQEGYSGREIAERLGYSPGKVTALIDAGELLHDAGPFAQEIKRDALSLTANSNKDERHAVLGALTGELLALAVQHYARVALHRKTTAAGGRLKAEPLSTWPLQPEQVHTGTRRQPTTRLGRVAKAGGEPVQGGGEAESGGVVAGGLV